MFIAEAARKRLKAHWNSLFGGDHCHVQVAALPWRKAGQHLEVMLITSRGTGRWVLPKGWPEGEEELFDAAAREAAEEAGLTGSISEQSVGSYHYDKLKASGEQLRCEVKVYPLEVDGVASKWRERRQRKRQWMTPEEAAASVHEPDLAQLIAAFAVNPRQRIAA
jgi:8-oxo-dGTP pyrophosphatase MutT (NUDIX family)